MIMERDIIIIVVVVLVFFTLLVVLFTSGSGITQGTGLPISLPIPGAGEGGAAKSALIENNTESGTG